MTIEENDLLQNYGDFSEVVTIAGDLIDTEEAEIPGVFADKELEVQAVVSDFTNSVTPPVGDTLTVASNSYRVERSLKSTDGIMVTLTMRRV